MVSDVPFGAFLSGGLDSSTIVALMTRHNPHVKTFSVGFGEGGYSELGYARTIAEHFETDHHELVVEPRPRDGAAARARGLSRRAGHRALGYPDLPARPGSVAQREDGAHGEGSDEVLGGYPKHVFERFAAPWQRVPGFVRHGLVAPLARSLPYRFRRAKTAITNLNIEDWPERYARWFGSCSRSERESLTVLRGNGFVHEPAQPPFDCDPNISTLRRILYSDQTSWLPDNLLERGDRMTMAASIESRVPFLDHELATYVSGLPDSSRVNGFETKSILRRAGPQPHPARDPRASEGGLPVPVNEWFRGPMKEYLTDHLQGADSRTRAYYDAKSLDGAIDEHLDGRQNHEKLLWSLLNLENLAPPVRIAQ
jgi:asparagine synthase (glutamine-hydrolysing)